jgi:hypothetical protein
MPTTAGAHFSLAPSTSRTSVEDLVRDISHGFWLLEGQDADPEPGLTTGIMPTYTMLEVRQGRPVAWISNHQPQLQFRTRQWWREQLRAVGDASTMDTQLMRTHAGMPWREIEQVATAPATLHVDVDVVRRDIKL